MASETMQILAVWKERPSLFASGLIQWVAESVEQEGHHRIRESPAFPLDDNYVTSTESDDDPYVTVNLDTMDADTRDDVEKMHAEFVTSLERDGWVRTGQGSSWYNLHFERAVRP